MNLSHAWVLNYGLSGKRGRNTVVGYSPTALLLLRGTQLLILGLGCPQEKASLRAAKLLEAAQALGRAAPGTRLSPDCRPPHRPYYKAVEEEAARRDAASSQSIVNNFMRMRAQAIHVNFQISHRYERVQPSFMAGTTHTHTHTHTYIKPCMQRTNG